ncbi:MAG: zinc ribbon domain-containing protein [Ruminococcus sp.]|nr:zinc ribbon domain-containing protein [Ruminococcus sp.]
MDIWKCTRCETTNEDKSVECIICHFEKPKPVDPTKTKCINKACGKDIPKGAAFCPYCSSAQSAKATKRWKCLGCGTSNPEMMRVCAKCGLECGKKPEPKKTPPLTPPPPPSPEEWQCPVCHTTNAASVVACTKCACPNDDKKEVVVWTCKKCGMENHDSRNDCYECEKKRPHRNKKMEIFLVVAIIVLMGALVVTAVLVSQYGSYNNATGQNSGLEWNRVINHIVLSIKSYPFSRVFR